MGRTDKPSVPAMIDIEVARSMAPRSVEGCRLRLPAGSTVLDALRACGLGADALAGVGSADWRVGVWGRMSPPEQVLRQGDRVEIYRALVADPKESRRLRYRAQHTRPKRR